MTVFGGLKQALIAQPRLSDAATILASTGFEATMPASNLLTYRPTDWARSTPGATSFRVDLELSNVNEFGEAETPSWDLVALLYANSGTAGTLRVMTASSAANLAADTFVDDDIVAAWPVADEFMAAWRRPWVHSFQLFVTPRTERFVAVEFSDTAPRFPVGWSSAEFLQASRIYVAKVWQPPRDIERGFTWAVDEQPEISKLEGGGDVVRAAAKPRVVTINAHALEESDAFDDAWELDELRGSSGDVFFIHNPNETQHLLKRAIYGRMERSQAIRNEGGGDYSHGYTIRELL